MDIERKVIKVEENDIMAYREEDMQQEAELENEKRKRKEKVKRDLEFARGLLENRQKIDAEENERC